MLIILTDFLKINPVIMTFVANNNILLQILAFNSKNTMILPAPSPSAKSRVIVFNMHVCRYSSPMSYITYGICGLKISHVETFQISNARCGEF